MAKQQRIHMDFALALCYLGEEEIALALGSLDNALEEGRMLGDLPAQIQLNHLSGLARFAGTQFSHAQENFLAGLEMLYAINDSVSFSGWDLIIELLTRLGALEYELGFFTDSEQFLREASSLLTARTPEDSMSAATIAWNFIQHHRSHGNLEHALKTAQSAGAIFAEREMPTASGRLQTIVADVALDLAESFSLEAETDARIAYITLARPYAQRGIEQTKSAGDLIGEGLARLAALRLDRLRGKERNRLASLNALERKARSIGDPALIGRLWTAQADEFAAAGNIEWARNRYYKAQRHLEEYELMAMARAPLRARLRLEEMNPDM